MNALKRAYTLTVTTLIAPVMSSVVWAQPGNPDRGHDLALRLCAQCHAIERQAAGPVMTDVPSFRSIATRPNVSAEYLAGRILVPHPEMPGVQLTRQELRDVIAYILDLK